PGPVLRLLEPRLDHADGLSGDLDRKLALDDLRPRDRLAGLDALGLVRRRDRLTGPREGEGEQQGGEDRTSAHGSKVTAGRHRVQQARRAEGWGVLDAAQCLAVFHAAA